jgi:hypothetical protein
MALSEHLALAGFDNYVTSASKRRLLASEPEPADACWG